MLKTITRQRIFGKVSLSIVCTLLLSNVSLSSVAGAQTNIDTFKIPGGNVLQRTVYNPTEFAGLAQSKESYQIIYGGNKLVTFGPKLNYLATQPIVPSGGAWTYTKDGSVIGISGCVGLTFGLDECSSISNLLTGKVLLTAQQGNPIDTHELVIDNQGNYWFFTDPKSDCKIASQLCSKYGVPQSKTFSDCQVNEVSPLGTNLFSWKASDHIPASMIITSYESEAPRKNYVDLFHCNSIDLVSPNSILISLRNTNSIFLVNLSTSSITWKLGGRYWPGISLLTSGFGTKVGSESVAQHDARSLGNGLFSFYDDNSHTNEAPRGIIFRVVNLGNVRKAVVAQIFKNPKDHDSLCTGSTRQSDLGNTVVGWGCSLNAITLFDNVGNPIVSLDKIETPETSTLFSHLPVIQNGVDWGPDYNYLLTYRVIPVPLP